MTSLMTIQCPENIILVEVDYLRNVIFTRLQYGRDQFWLMVLFKAENLVYIDPVILLYHVAIWLWASEDCGQNVDGNDNYH